MSSGELRFGTDGVRGKAGEGCLDPAAVERLGAALGDFLKERRPSPPVVVLGGDTRASREEISANLGRGLARRGIRCVDLGVLPTAGVALVAGDYGAACAAVISASHNPAEDNGIKLFVGSCEKLGDEDARWIEARWSRVALDGTAPSSPREHRSDGAERYLQHLLERAGDLDLSGIAVALDLAHGAAFRVGPELFRRLGAHVFALGDAPDGRNINAGCGSLHPRPLQERVRECGADFGLAVDGDADRSIFVDPAGRRVDGDGILAAMAADLLRRNRLPGRTVVGTIMTNFGLELFLKERGVTLERTPVGDRHVSARLREGGFGLGGEPSGHVIFGSDLSYLGDGLYTALRVAELLQRSGQNLSEAVRQLSLVPQVLIPVPVAARPELAEISGLREKLADAEKKLDGTGRVVLRYSGTEPVLRVMVEGADGGLVDDLAQGLANHLAEQIGRR